MKRAILVAMLLLFPAGYGCRNKPQDTVVKINNYTISRLEFEREFKDSRFGRDNAPESRKEFLDNLIDRVLILQDAQEAGLDNDPRFLKMVEKYWEQSLLKLALDNKSRELAGASLVGDKAVEEAYQAMLKKGEAVKPYEEVYQQVKWGLTRLKEAQMMNEWLARLHRNARIWVRRDLVPREK